jgi:DNA-binding NarL/FixJ family response regulator
MFEIDLRILIVADDSLARTGLATLLEDWPGCLVVGQIAGLADVEAALDVYRPDVLLWDLGWDPSAALERLVDLAPGEPPVVALLPDDEITSEVWTAGARGLLLREVTSQSLVTALAAVAQGLMVVDPTLADSLEPPGNLAPTPLDEELTPRELEVLQLVAEGLSNRAIGYRLGISEHTVKFHVNAIMSKLGAQSRTEAAVRATRLGLVIL